MYIAKPSKFIFQRKKSKNLDDKVKISIVKTGDQNLKQKS